MEPSRDQKSAFTLIELMIVIFIIAVLAVGFSVSFQRARQKAIFDDHEAKIINLIQKARGLSLTNLLVGGTEEAAYYRLVFNTDSLDLVSFGVGTLSETIESFEFDEDYQLYVSSSTCTTSSTPLFSVYYFPPYGEMCFSSNCAEGYTAKTYSFHTCDRNYQTNFVITTTGGFPEVL